MIHSGSTNWPMMYKGSNKILDKCLLFKWLQHADEALNIVMLYQVYCVNIIRFSTIGFIL